MTPAHTHANQSLLSLFAAPLLLLLAAVGAAAEDDGPRPVRMLHSFDLTPDGKTLVFSWRGDLWRVPTAGGAAMRLTFHPANDGNPRISPNGRQVAFVSNREGTNDVHTMPISGGRPRRVTLHTEGFQLYDWYPNGEALLVRGRLDHHWRRSERFFRRPLDQDAPLELLFDDYGGSGRLSPDGGTLAFTREGVGWARKGYRGSQSSQVWLYDLAAKTFEKLTARDHAEHTPLWANDGRHLWVTSDESGTFNLISIDLETGSRHARTSFVDDGVRFPALSRDGSTIAFLRQFDLYRLDTTPGAKPERIDIRDVGDPTVDTVLHRTLTKATAVAFTNDAREIAFAAGGDIWVMDTELREPKQVTDTPEEEREPVFSTDFETLTFVSDLGGQPDIWVARRADTERWWWQNDTFPLERITDDVAVQRSISLTPDGKRLAYVQDDGDLWTMNPDGTDRVQVLASVGEPYYDFSPDGRWVAYAVFDDDYNRDVFIRSADGKGEPFNVSRHPDWDGNPAWSPDGRILAFLGSRWHDERDICFVWLRKEDEQKEKRDRTLEKALEKMEGRRKKDKGTSKGNGKGRGNGKGTGEAPDAAEADDTPTDPLAGVWKGTITGAPPMPPEGFTFELELSRREDGTIAGHVEVAGLFSGPLENLEVDTEGGTLAFSMTTPFGLLFGEAKVAGDTVTGTWKVEGVTSGTFELSRKGQDEAAGEGDAKPDDEKEPEPVEIDFDGLEDRIHRISIPDAHESFLLWSSDAKKLAFEANIEGEAGLYTVAFPDDLKPKKLTSTTGRSARWLETGNQIAWLVSGRPATMSASGKAKSYGFSVNQVVDVAARNAAAFDQAWRVMRDQYYDARLGGRDWDAIGAKYRPLAASALTPDALETVVNMMLGELNGSHLGFRASKESWSKRGWREITRHLGVRFDPAFPGPGLRVRNVVPDTPADEEQHRLESGDLILTIDGVEVGPRTRLARVLRGPPEREVALTVRGTDGEERTLTYRPTTYGAVRRRLYDVWLDQECATVERLSEGRLGYLHVRGMNWPSFERFEAELYKVGHGKAGLIIDVRNNGGGYTTDHLLTVLTQPRHAMTVGRAGKPGYPQDRMVYARWDRPVVVLCNQNSFSNAEIFAHAVKTLARGRIVGVPTGGGVISTGGTTILDVGTLRLPFRGWFLLDSGEDMELNGCVPDVVVWPEPGELPAGRDRQLEKAVEVLLEDVASGRAGAFPKPKYASERSSTDGE